MCIIVRADAPSAMTQALFVGQVLYTYRNPPYDALDSEAKLSKGTRNPRGRNMWRVRPLDRSIC